MRLHSLTEGPYDEAQDPFEMPSFGVDWDHSTTVEFRLLTAGERIQVSLSHSTSNVESLVEILDVSSLGDLSHFLCVRSLVETIDETYLVAWHHLTTSAQFQVETLDVSSLVDYYHWMYVACLVETTDVVFPVVIPVVPSLVAACHSMNVECLVEIPGEGFLVYLCH